MNYLEEYELFEVKGKRKETLYGEIIRGNFTNVRRLAKTESIEAKHIEVAIANSKFTIFKYLIARFDFENHNNVEILKISVKKICGIDTDYRFKKSSIFAWISLLLRDVDWDEKDNSGNDFLFYACDELKDKIMKKYPEKYEIYLKNQKRKEFNL